MASIHPKSDFKKQFNDGCILNFSCCQVLVPTMQRLIQNMGKRPVKDKYGKILQIYMVYCTVFLRIFL